ncbi:MAG: cation:proton antiporter, partial [Rhodospirillaceae bacterium]|nr:cation:proton antiporter [Rhodospirillaceae bacterium]
LIFAGTGYAALFGGGNFLDYDALSANPVAGQHLGILVIEFGVGTTVAASMITIFFLFAGRDR